MNLKQLISLLVLVAVLGGAGLAIYNHRKTSWNGNNAAAGKKLLGEFPVNDVARIAIKHGTNEVNLVKQDDLWRVRERHDYPANFSRISEFLLKARDLKIVQSEKVGPSQLPRLQLVAGPGTNSPVMIEFKGAADKPMQTLLLGKPHLKKSAQPALTGDDEGFPDGRYVKTGSGEDVALISDPLDVQLRPEEWLNKDFLKVEKAKAVEVVFPAATNSWKLTRDTESAPWTLADARPDEQFDPAKTVSTSNPLGSLSFTDVLPGGKLEGTGTNAPVTVKIETFEHFDYTIVIGRKTNEEYPVTVAVTAQLPNERTPGKDEKPEAKAKLDQAFKDQQQKLGEKLKQEQGFANWTYLVPAWSLDSLLKDRAQLMAEKKEESKAGGEASTGAEGEPEEPKIENPPLPLPEAKP